MIDAPLFALAPSYAPQARVAANFAPPPKPRYSDATYAVVPIQGTLFKPQSVWIRQEVARLAADASVGEIILHIDSPGGETAGIADCASAVAAAAAVKPVTAFIEDIGASAAYWIASQATRVIANRTAVVGSIGVYLALADSSKFWERLGIDWIVIRSSGATQKGGAVEGVKISREVLEGLQTRVDALARIFIADVAKGRRKSIEQIREIADGRIFTGAAAQAAGLVDAISTLYDVGQDARRRTLHLVRGSAAVAAFNELVAVETRKRGYESSTWRSVVAEQYPELAAAVAAEHEAAAKLSKYQPSSRWRD